MIARQIPRSLQHIAMIIRFRSFLYLKFTNFMCQSAIQFEETVRFLRGKTMSYILHVFTYE